MSVFAKVLGRQRLHPGIDAGIVFLEAQTSFHASFHLILPQCLCKWGTGNNRRVTINTNSRTLHNKCHHVIYSGLEFIYLKPFLTKQMNLYNHIVTHVTLFLSIKQH